METLNSIPPTHWAVPVYIIFILLEFAKGHLYGGVEYEARDTAVNLWTTFFAGIERLAAGVFYAFILLFAYEYRFFTLEFSWTILALCFVVDDLKYYWKHRIEHTVRWAWASHVVHHSSQHFNLSTPLRQTWTYAFTGLILLNVPLVLLGFHPAMIGFCAALNLVYQFFIHTEAVRRMPWWYEAIMNTPSHHRVHHATNPRYLDANYAGTLIIWDKMFGTFVPERDDEPCRYGIVKNLNTFNLLVVQFHEWITIWKDVTQPNISFTNRLKYMYKPPGWSHDGSRETSEMIKQQFVRLNPETGGQPGLPSEPKSR